MVEVLRFQVGRNVAVVEDRATVAEALRHELDAEVGVLVRGSVEGRCVCYCVDREGLRRLRVLVAGL